MADYGCFPIWDLSGTIGNIDPNSLPISSDLKCLLLHWSAWFDQTLDQSYPPNSGFKNLTEEKNFQSQGVQLANLLREELGPDFQVIFGGHGQ